MANLPQARPAATCLLPTVYCLLLFLAAPAFSEPMGWAATYGGAKRDSADSIQQTSDGGYIVAGEAWSFGSRQGDVWVLKLRADGIVEWQKTYGGVGWDAAESVQQTMDGGYIVAGWTNSFGARGRNLWILKLRPDGALEWQKSYSRGGWNEARSIQQTSDRGYIVAGITNSFGAGAFDFWVLKLWPDGTVEWQKTYGGVGWEYANSIQQTSEGGFIVAGFTDSFGAGVTDFWVLKLGPDGAVEWQKTYGGAHQEWLHSVSQTGEGGYVVAGFTDSFGVEINDVWVIKLWPDGTVEWQKTYGEEGIEWQRTHGKGGSASSAWSIQQTGDGGYVLAGRMETLTAEGEGYKFYLDLLVLKLKPDGIVEWQKTYGGALDECADSIQQTRDGGYIVAGRTESYGYGGKYMPDFWVLKLRPDGFFGSAQDKSIDPACEFIKETNLSVKDSNATVKDTTVSPVDSNANPQASSAIVQDTNAPVDFCPPTSRP